MKEKSGFSRYSRQIAIKSVGEEGQRKLREGSVGIIGCGALGSVAAMYLAGAGVGRIGLADFDTIDISNLQRQVFYREDETGCLKLNILKDRICALNKDITIECHNQIIKEDNIANFISRYDFIVDATDNPASKKMIDRWCKQQGKPLTTGGVSATRGQVTTSLPDSRRFSSIYPDVENNGIAPCSIEGVLGPAAGIVASIQASEAIKYFIQPDQILKEKLLIFDLEMNLFQIINY